MTSALEDGLLIVTSDTACQTVPNSSGSKLVIRVIMTATLPAMELKGYLVTPFLLFDTNRCSRNPATLSIPVSLSSHSSWMNAGDPVTLRMTEAS